MDALKEVANEARHHKWQLDYLFNSILGREQRKNQSFILLDLCEGNPPANCGFPSYIKGDSMALHQHQGPWPSVGGFAIGGAIYTHHLLMETEMHRCFAWWDIRADDAWVNLHRAYQWLIIKKCFNVRTETITRLNRKICLLAFRQFQWWKC